ncbi:MAG: hypothetical protein ACTHYA_10345, partial [Ancrocorticia populi]|uniref:hypothetical protein n=1 Tax=Ancrocorticia populi TaxID=2175228 RepID=UPI003F8EA423
LLAGGAVNASDVRVSASPAGVGARTSDQSHSLEQSAFSAVTRVRMLCDDDIRAANTLEDPERVTLREVAASEIAGGELLLPPVSWAAIEFSL